MTKPLTLAEPVNKTMRTDSSLTETLVICGPKVSMPSLHDAIQR